MFGSLTSYIFGADDSDSSSPKEPKAPELRTHPTISDDEDWVVVVSGSSQPPLTLGSLNEMIPRPHTGSTGPSSASSEAGADGEEEGDEEAAAVAAVEQGDDSSPEHQVALSRTERRRVSPFGSCPSNNTLLLPQLKTLRSAQKSRQKEHGKAMTAKAMGRQNKAVKQNQSHSKKKSHVSVSMKGAGNNKQLKLC